MSLLTAAKHKSPNMGYTPDFIEVAIIPFIKEIKEQGIKLITNAGGVNPEACANAVMEAAKAQGIDVRIAVVLGDDMISRIDEVTQDNVKEIDSGQELPSRVVSMNAYLGAMPIARALDMGADIVITGRCVDSALALGPLIHEFGWKPHEYDLLAAGSLAGHLIECGAQCTGGISTDWQVVSNWQVSKHLALVARKVNGGIHKITNPTVPPVIHPPRKVPFALRDKFEMELKRMEQLDVIEKVTEPTEWVNSYVITEKSNGKLRVLGSKRLEQSHQKRTLPNENYRRSSYKA
ncbi:hypothetical protein QZH41_017956 [Actinostola sp. cb2023]|nr:hypothetical protein QZH41_017956 [Actinostola sp. cb2023]